jgi:hypothetical protein
MTRSTTVKKIILFAIVAATMSLGACCFGPDGDVYLSFDWTYTPEWFATDDYSLPDTIYRKAIYLTDEGSYYFEYYHEESGYIRWIHYSLEAHDGFFGIRGEDAVFELFLAAFEDPTFIQWQSETGESAGQPDAVPAATATARTPDQLVPAFERTMESGGWTLRLQGGVIEPTGR